MLMAHRVVFSSSLVAVFLFPLSHCLPDQQSETDDLVRPELF